MTAAYFEDHPTDPDKVILRKPSHSTDCPNCEYHKNRAARWRAEAYAQAGHDIIERPWVGLTEEDIQDWIAAAPAGMLPLYLRNLIEGIEAELKEKNVSTL